MHSVSSTKMSKHIADYTQQKSQQFDLFQKTARSEVIWETLLSLGSMKKGSKLNLNQELPSQNLFFWSNPYKTEVMITSLIELLELTKLWSHDHINNIFWVTWRNFVADVIDRSHDVITFISKYLYFKSNHFCWK